MTNIPLDGRLLGNAIIELNISRHNVSIYPKDHPIVKTSLNRSFDFLQRLFELRHEMTLAIAKDTIIVDGYALSKHNPVFKDFALYLNSMNIASVEFSSGLTKKELYSFHSFLSRNREITSPEKLKMRLEDYGLIHIKTRFVDYTEFNLVPKGHGLDDNEGIIWEQYIYELIGGNLQSDNMNFLFK